jgi:hypothetical protein
MLVSFRMMRAAAKPQIRMMPRSAVILNAGLNYSGRFGDKKYNRPRSL